MAGPNGDPMKGEQRESTLVSEEELRQRAAAEGIDVDKISVIVPRWAESKPREDDAQSALVRCDLIVRSDGSAVYLDGMMGSDSQVLAGEFLLGKANPQELPWHQWVEAVTALPG